jgi:hypothetical protein
MLVESILKRAESAGRMTGAGITIRDRHGRPHCGWHYAGLACITVDGVLHGREMP